jgi:uncharacterized protein
MKFLFLLVVVLVVVWAIKRGSSGRSSPKKPPESSAPAEMVTCAHCGIHLPHSEAVTGQKGLYCSTEHRSAAQDSNPA